WTWGTLARIALDQGDLDSARRYAGEAIRAAREGPDKSTLASALNTLGRIGWYKGDLQEARRYFEASLDLWREVQDQEGVALTTSCVGLIEVLGGEFARGTALLEEGLKICEQSFVGFSDIPLYGLAESARRQGDAVQAVKWYSRFLRLLHERNKRLKVPDGLEGLAMVALAQGRHPRAVRLLGASAALRDEFGVPAKPIDRGEYDLTLSRLHELLGEDEFNAQWLAGRGLGYEQAMAFALDES
ncbi:MAG: tetratricopeptide repeat protein, partial [Rudaea sp.]